MVLTLYFLKNLLGHTRSMFRAFVLHEHGMSTKLPQGWEHELVKNLHICTGIHDTIDEYHLSHTIRAHAYPYETTSSTMLHCWNDAILVIILSIFPWIPPNMLDPHLGQINWSLLCLTKEFFSRRLLVHFHAPLHTSFWLFGAFLSDVVFSLVASMQVHIMQCGTYCLSRHSHSSCRWNFFRKAAGTCLSVFQCQIT